jgi:hypothetical protein
MNIKKLVCYLKYLRFHDHYWEAQPDGWIRMLHLNSDNASDFKYMTVVNRKYYANIK